MGLAACHTLPRDVVMRVCLLAVLVAMLLQMVALFDAANRSRLAWFVVENADQSTGEDAVVTPFEMLMAGEQGKRDRRTVCPAPPTATYSCDDIEAAGDASAAVLIVTILVSLAALVGSAAYVAYGAQKNTHVFAAFSVALLVIFLLSFASVLVMGIAMHDAIEDFFDDFGIDTKRQIDLSHGAALLIAAAVIDLLALAVAAVRLFQFELSNVSLKTAVRRELCQPSNEPYAGEHAVMVDQRMEHRIVNDDWTRQKAIWMERRKVVVATLKSRGLDSAEVRKQILERRGIDMTYFFHQSPKTTDLPAPPPTKVQHSNDSGEANDQPAGGHQHPPPQPMDGPLQPPTAAGGDGDDPEPLADTLRTNGDNEAAGEDGASPAEEEKRSTTPPTVVL